MNAAEHRRFGRRSPDVLGAKADSSRERNVRYWLEQLGERRVLSWLLELSARRGVAHPR